MSEVFNAICPGFAFAQDFDTDPGAIPNGAVLWLNLRRATGSKPVVLNHVELVRVSANKFRLALSARETTLLIEGLLEGDFVQRLNSVDVPLMVRIMIPVVDIA